MTNNRIVVLVALSEYNLGIEKCKISVLLDECFVLFANFYVLLDF
jgi:hypothetical protein